MKTCLATVFVLLLLGALPALGQTGTALEAEVPFAFEMSGVVLPAGSYQLLLRMPLLVRNIELPEYGVIVGTRPWSPGASEAPAIQLVFNKYGERYFLSQVWSWNEHYVLPKSKQERELVTSRVVAGLLKPERVTVLAQIRK